MPCTKNISKWLLKGKSPPWFNKSSLLRIPGRSSAVGGHPSSKQTRAIDWPPGIKPPWRIIPAKAHCCLATFPAGVLGGQMSSFPPLAGCSSSCRSRELSSSSDFFQCALKLFTSFYLELGFSHDLSTQHEAEPWVG